MSKLRRTSVCAAAVSAAVFSVVSPVNAAPAPATGLQSQPDSTKVSRPYQRLIVGYKPGTAAASSDDAASESVKKKGKSVHRRMANGAVVINLGARTTSAEATIQEFKKDPDVAFVEPDVMMQPFAVPNDAEYSRQWDLHESTAGMNVPDAWNSTTGSGVTVAVIDTGYVSHSDLSAQIVPGYDFVSDAADARDGNGRDNDPSDTGDWARAGDCGTDFSGGPIPPADEDSSWHGTHVAGTIAASTNNAKGIAGIAYGAKIQPIRVLARCGGATSDIADAITWASGGSVRGVPANPTPAKVINMSLGGQSACSSTYQNAINGAIGRGTTVVVAAGNSSDDASFYTPASCAGVITVAASGRQGSKAFYSNYGSRIDITAPGGETRRGTDTPGTITTPENGIWSTLNTGTTSPGSENYQPYQGTSMAAPHIAGLAALLMAKKPSLTPTEVKALIKNNARPLPGICSGGCGAGLADAAKTVNAVNGGTTPPPPVCSTPTGAALTNSTDVVIPDEGTGTSSIVSKWCGSASYVEVSVAIRHKWRGDLVINLITPSGTSYRLKNANSSDSADDVVATYAGNIPSESAAGTWKLEVKDVEIGISGVIDSWSIILM